MDLYLDKWSMEDREEGRKAGRIEGMTQLRDAILICRSGECTSVEALVAKGYDRNVAETAVMLA